MYFYLPFFCARISSIDLSGWKIHIARCDNTLNSCPDNSAVTRPVFRPDTDAGKAVTDEYIFSLSYRYADSDVKSDTRWLNGVQSDKSGRWKSPQNTRGTSVPDIQSVIGHERKLQRLCLLALKLNVNMRCNSQGRCCIYGDARAFTTMLPET